MLHTEQYNEYTRVCMCVCIYIHIHTHIHTLTHAAFNFAWTDALVFQGIAKQPPNGWRVTHTDFRPRRATKKSSLHHRYQFRPTVGSLRSIGPKSAGLPVNTLRSALKTCLFSVLWGNNHCLFSDPSNTSALCGHNVECSDSRNWRYFKVTARL